MSGSRLDDLSKNLASQTSRRGVLKAFLGGLAALVAGTALAPEPSEAQTGSCLPTRPCTFNQQALQPSLAFCRANFPIQGPPGTMTSGCCEALAPCSQGPAFQCGPGAPQGHPALCAGACCPANAPGCCNGACTDLCSKLRELRPRLPHVARWHGSLFGRDLPPAQLRRGQGK